MKKTLLFILALVGLTTANAATDNWVWAKPLGSTDMDKVSAITTDASGNVYVAGMFTGPTLVLNPTTSLAKIGAASIGNIYVAKYDPAGNLMWAKNGGGTNSPMNPTIEDIAISPDANKVYVVGTSWENLLFDTATIPVGYGSFYLELSGTTGSAISHGIIQNGKIASVEADNNALYVAGYFNALTLTIGLTTITNPDLNGTASIFLAKLNNSAAVWTSAIGGGDYVRPSDIHLDKNGDLLVAATYKGRVTPNSNIIKSNGGSEILLAKYYTSSNGNLAWVKSIGGIRDEAAASITSDNNANVYITGSFKSVNFTFAGNTVSHTSAFGENMLLAKYASNGTEVWVQTAGGPIADYVLPTCVSVDTDDNIYVAGSYNNASVSFGSITLSKLPNFLVKYDAAGTAIWGQGYAGLAVSYMKPDNAGNVYLAGEYDRRLTMGDDTLSNNGGNDVWVGKMLVPIAPSAVNSVLSSKYNMNVYPNPAANNVTIDGNWHHGELTIVDVTGKVVFNTSAKAPYNLNTGNFANGNYIINLHTQDGVASAKFAVEK